MADKRTRACIFCGGTPVTKEHLWPQWVTGTLKRGPRRLRRPVTIQMTTGSGPSHEWSCGDDINVTAKRVCRQCNSGWMANLEESALPLLQKMMMGRIVSLDTHGQTVVARWLALRALVFRYFAQPITEPEREWLDYFYEHQVPPPTCYQWITAYNGQKPFHYAGNDITASDVPGRATEPWHTPHGILMTLVIGYLAAKLLWIRKGEPGDLDPSGLVRVWPARNTAVIWPPRTPPLDETGLEALTRMFLSPP